MTLRAAIDELEALTTELRDLRDRLAVAYAEDDRAAMYELEVALRHVGARATARADLLQRAMELDLSRAART